MQLSRARLQRTGFVVAIMLLIAAAHVVGIGRYQHLSASQQLKFARKDAEDVRDILVKSFGFLPQNIAVLLDEAATKKAIERELDATTLARVDQAADKIIARLVTAQEVVIKPGDIVKRQKLEKSLMPEGLAAGISVTDLASLVDYLESLAHGGK